MVGSVWQSLAEARPDRSLTRAVQLALVGYRTATVRKRLLPRRLSSRLARLGIRQSKHVQPVSARGVMNLRSDGEGHLARAAAP